MAIDKELLDRLLAGRDPNEVFSRDGLLDDLKKALSERILNTELDEHLFGWVVLDRATPSCTTLRQARSIDGEMPISIATCESGRPLLSSSATVSWTPRRTSPFQPFHDSLLR